MYSEFTVVIIQKTTDDATQFSGISIDTDISSDKWNWFNIIEKYPKKIVNQSNMNKISHPVDDVNHSLNWVSGRVLPDQRFPLFKDGYSRESFNIYY